MIVDEYIEPAVLTGYIREIPLPYNLVLNQYLPDRNIGDIEAAIDQVTRVNRAAEFRSWDTESPISTRDRFQRSKVKLPPISTKLPIGEQERLMLERIRTGGDNRNAYVQDIYNDAAQLRREVLNRMEVARGDVLMDGKFTLVDENGLTLEADFGVPADNLVSPDVAWSDTENAQILPNLKTWVDAYVDINGERPGRMVTSNTVISNMLLSDEIRALFYRGQTLAGAPNLITQPQLNQTLTAYGLPPIVEYNTKLQVKGVNSRVIDDGMVVFLPENPEDLGYTAWGITAEALELATGQNPSLEFQDLPGLVGVVLKEGDPLRVWTKVGAVGMPLITDPQRLMVADVL